MDVLRNTYQYFLDCSSNKKVVLWGAGSFPIVKKILNDTVSGHAYWLQKIPRYKFTGLQVTIDYLVDSDFWKWGNSNFGLMVYPVEHLNNESDKEKLVVLIAHGDIFSGAEILEQMGIYQYFSFHLFSEELSQSQYGCFIGALFKLNN
jgi:hypothetical protein